MKKKAEKKILHPPSHPCYTADRVDKNVWISGQIAAYNKDFLKKFNITRIVKLFREDGDEKYIYPGLSYLLIDAKDSPDYKISEHFKDIADFIQTGLDHDEQILIHCQAGVSRSATVVIMYLTLCGMSTPRAYRLLKNKREVVKPNPGFIKQLVKWRYWLYGKAYCADMWEQMNKISEEKSIKLPDIKK